MTLRQLVKLVKFVQRSAIRHFSQIIDRLFLGMEFTFSFKISFSPRSLLLFSSSNSNPPQNPELKTPSQTFCTFSDTSIPLRPYLKENVEVIGHHTEAQHLHATKLLVNAHQLHKFLLLHLSEVELPLDNPGTPCPIGLTYSSLSEEKVARRID